MGGRSCGVGTHKEMAFSQFGPPQIGIEEITIGESIGSGCFGGVYKGFCRGINVAVKIPHRGVVNPSQFRKEVNVLSKINHPNVCLFMGACLSRPKVMIVSELMCGDVENLVLNKKNKFKLSELIGFAIDAARGMAWLHGNKPPVFHRDLKIANLLYDETMKVKVFLFFSFLFFSFLFFSFLFFSFSFLFFSFLFF